MHTLDQSNHLRFITETVLNTCPLGVVGFDKKGTILLFNQKAEEITGFLASEVVGRVDIKTLLGSDEKIREVKGIMDSLGLGGPGRAGEIETTIVQKNGESLRIVLSISLIREASWELGSIGFFRQKGILDSGSAYQKQYLTAQKALQDCEQRYQSLLDASPDAIVLYDPLGHVTYLNPSFTQMFGWEIQEVGGKKLVFVPEESSEETRLAVGRMLSGEKVICFRTRRLTRDGRKLDVQLSASMVYDQEGKVLGTIVIFRDITDQLRVEQEKARQDRLQGVLEMAIAATHEMSQPLQIIVGDSSYLVREMETESDWKEAAENIMKAATQLGEVVYKIQRINRYKTVIYVGESTMVDLEKASQDSRNND